MYLCKAFNACAHTVALCKSLPQRYSVFYETPVLLLFITLLPSPSLSQGRISYSYDAGGYRVRREIIMPYAPREAKESVSGLGEQVFSEKIEEHSEMLCC